MKFLDLFAGIGGFRLGMEAAGHECIGFCEIDKFARASYKAIHDTKGEIELHDITAVTDEFIRGIGSVDVICGGFPCQTFSIAGNRRGFEDTRGTLFFDIARFASILRPKYLFLENVKGLLNHDGGATFETILNTLDELGYNVEWQVLNSKNFGVPQNRERVFLVGHLRGKRTRRLFPIGRESTTFDPKSKEIIIVGNTKNPTTKQKGTRSVVYHNKGLIGTTLSSHSCQENNHTKVYDFYNKRIKDEVGTLTASGHQGNTKAGTFGILDGYRIRKLTPRECWRLQGFPDWAFDKAQAVNSNSQLYKQAGNSVTVNVIEAIAKQFR
ncbi:Cytosine-specific methyltransferase [Streptococcus pluranimalium]|uniref:DNA cytosine methyltransferase n=1 Tax=Streptococcus pluranimalium TaxID=82348 RepID=UPI0039ECBF2A